MACGKVSFVVEVHFFLAKINCVVFVYVYVEFDWKNETYSCSAMETSPYIFHRLL